MPALPSSKRSSIIDSRRASLNPEPADGATPGCPSSMLNKLSLEKRKSLAGITAISLPAEDLAGGQWCLTVLENVVRVLGLSVSLAEAFGPLTEHAQSKLPPENRQDWHGRVLAFSAAMPSEAERYEVLRDLIVVVALRCGYDARTRVTFRRICAAMGVPWRPGMLEIESLLAHKVHERAGVERERDIKGDKWRNYKIGAAMIGGGALLAVTGGLAAPALAAGIAASGTIIGTSTAAALGTFATTTWAATVFGATGAGLLGYKMDRRTQGVTEFTFELESDGAEMSVVICVPGLLRDPFDYQRAWGVDPIGLPASERLRRFYAVYNPEKGKDVEQILREWHGSEADLCRAIKERYGVDPRDRLTAAIKAQSAQRKEGQGAGDPPAGVPGGSPGEHARRVDTEAIEALMEAVMRDLQTNVVEDVQHEKDTLTDRSSGEPVAHTKRPGASPLEEAVAENVGKMTIGQEAGGGAAAPEEESGKGLLRGWSARAEPGSESIPAAGGGAKPKRRSSKSGALAGMGSAVKGWKRKGSRSSGEGPPALGEEGGGSGKPMAPKLQKVVELGYSAEWVKAAAARCIANKHEGGAEGRPPASSEGNEGGAEGEVAALPGVRAGELVLFIEEHRGEMDAFCLQDRAVEDSRKASDDQDKCRVWFWEECMPHTDQYLLRWETGLLIELGQSVETLLASAAKTALQETLTYTALSTLMAALTWPLAIISLADYIDTDWTVGCERADTAGKLLADALLAREQGCRPVMLIGYSIGARLIFSCLEEMARRHALWEQQTQEREGGKAGAKKKFFQVGSKKPDGSNPDARSAEGIIENVVLIGAPVSSSATRWEKAARMVHGRMINGHCDKDWILSLIYRAKSLSLNVAGIQQVNSPLVENIELSSVVSNHFDYVKKMPDILGLLELDSVMKYVNTLPVETVGTA